MFVLRPDRQAPSSWIEHIPFAYWIVYVLKPHCIVELGTEYGVSYCALCQMVKAMGLPTRCVAIDTWQGDKKHTIYNDGDEKYKNLKEFNDNHYGRFSELRRSTFDDALPTFEDNSIDLLHIDGLHTYEAVRHDYESWLPKMTKNSVIMFHDTDLIGNDFGVYKLWEEITPGKPHFSFEHGCGLGVLGLGRVYPEPLTALFMATDFPEEGDNIRKMFSEIGSKLANPS
jgi:O-antigen biosynthesis protein